MTDSEFQKKMEELKGEFIKASSVQPTEEVGNSLENELSKYQNKLRDDSYANLTSIEDAASAMLHPSVRFTTENPFAAFVNEGSAVLKETESLEGWVEIGYGNDNEFYPNPSIDWEAFEENRRETGKFTAIWQDEESE